MEIVKHEHWANESFLSTLGFTHLEGNKFEKTRRVMINQQILNQTVELSVYEEHPELGVEVEVRWDGELQASGYWHDEEDFNTERTLW